MGKIFKYFVYSLLLFYFFIWSLELTQVLYYKNTYSKNEIPFKKNSLIYSIVNEKSQDHLFKSQKKASVSRLHHMFILLLFLTSSAFLIISFFYKRSVSIAKNISESTFSSVKSGFRNLNVVEINFITFLISCYFLSHLIFDLIFYANKITFGKIAKVVGMFILSYFLIIPLVLFLLYILFDKFKGMLIFAAYLSYVIFLLHSFTTIDDVDYEKMERMDISSFDKVVIEQLEKYNLQDKVYSEIKPGDDRNAALVGYGSNRRIEVYGDFLNKDKKGLFSVLLHEIGHANDNSLLKKMTVYVLIVICEFLIILYLYQRLAYKFTNMHISHLTSFIFLCFIYFIFIRIYICTLFKLISQYSEYKSDLYAKKYGMGVDLAKTLYSIVVDENEYLSPNPLFNVFRSSHPPITTRINQLS